jgi:type I site-specific restriction endonuclease
MNPNRAPIDYDAFRREARCLRQQAIDAAVTRVERAIARGFDRIRAPFRLASGHGKTCPGAALTTR